jgi:hypothetical protein
MQMNVQGSKHELLRPVAWHVVLVTGCACMWSSFIMAVAAGLLPQAAMHFAV